MKLKETDQVIKLSITIQIVVLIWALKITKQHKANVCVWERKKDRHQNWSTTSEFKRKTCEASRLENDTREMFSCISFNMRLKESIEISLDSNSWECFKTSNSFSSSWNKVVTVLLSQWIWRKERKKKFIIDS